MIFNVLQILSVIAVAVAFATALAHALEWPGKMRLNKETYMAVQAIYYPGFTAAGASEPIGIILTGILLFFAPDGARFWLTLVAFFGLIGMHAVYWLFTHPVNKFWLEGEDLGKFGTGFFSFRASRSGLEKENPPDWTNLRDRWEYSHLARAGLALVSLIALVIAISGE